MPHESHPRSEANAQAAIDPTMWDEEAAGESSFPAIENSTTLYRLVMARRLHPRDHVLRGTFLRRKPKEDGTPRDTKGLSTALPNGKQHSEMIDAQFARREKPCAVCYLSVSDVTSIAIPGTSLTIDVRQSSSDHANIKRLPPHGQSGQFPALAEKLATELAKRAQVQE